MKPLRLSALFAVLVLAGRAQFTATYDFATAATNVPSVTNVTFTALTGTNVTVSYSSTDQITTTNQWTPSGSSADTTEYLSVGLTAASGYELTLTQLTLKESRTTGGPASISVGLFVGGSLQETSATFTTFQTGPTATSFMTSHTFDFADVGPIASTSSAEFRIYGWGGATLAGPLRLDDLVISGSVAASSVPEPSTWVALCGLAALAGTMAVRRNGAAPACQRALQDVT